jgi:hypothetical protein
VVSVTPDPGLSASERLRDLEQAFALLRHALDKIADEDQRRANLSKAAAARAGELDDELHGVVALLPPRRGRHLEEIPPNFLQKVKTLHEERGWGRGRILSAMRAEGAKEWMVRRALREIAGGNSGSSHSSQATFPGHLPTEGGDQ